MEILFDDKKGIGLSDLDDGVESEDGVGVLGVSGQGHLEVRVHAEVESGRHVAEANLLFPPDDITLN